MVFEFSFHKMYYYTTDKTSNGLAELCMHCVFAHLCFQYHGIGCLWFLLREPKTGDISYVTSCFGLQEKATSSLSHVHNMGVSHSRYHADGMISSTQPIYSISVHELVAGSQSNFEVKMSQYRP